MTLLIFGLMVLAIFLLAVLGAAWMISVRFADSSASYPLFAVRDRIIDAVVFKGVGRDDPWVDYLYDSVNVILAFTNLLKGPEAGWARGRQLGRVIARLEEAGQAAVLPPPGHDPPPVLEPIVQEFSQALKHLEVRHTGVRIMRSTAAREWSRVQRRKAREMRRALRDAHSCLAPA